MKFYSSSDDGTLSTSIGKELQTAIAHILTFL
jgi:hypothetical protein